MSDLFSFAEAIRRPIEAPPPAPVPLQPPVGNSEPVRAPSSLRSGLCEGGPYAGQPLHHGCDRMYVAFRRGEERRGPIVWAGPETTEVYFGTYEHDGAKWCWNDGNGDT
jgi:hypothetical protein